MTTQKRFELRVQKTATCWLWLGAKNKDGYGKLGLGPKNDCQYWLAHRYAYFLTHGSIPQGASVLHQCDVPACVRVDHLFLGTQADNMKDMAVKRRSKKGRTNPHAPLGTDHGMSRLKDHHIREIREAVAAGAVQKYLAPKYGVSVQHISDIVTRKRWKHI